MANQGTLILPDWLIQRAGDPPRNSWGVRILGSTIDDVADHKTLVARYPEDKLQRIPESVLAPGFVNAHMHAYGVLAHGIPLAHAPTGFWPFLEDFWWPKVEDALDHEMIRAATDLQCARMLMSGVTTFYDCLEAPHALSGCLATQAEVVRQHGMRAILSFEATERVSSENGELGLQENVEFIQAHRNDPLISGLMCYHTTFTCSEPFVRRAFELAREHGTLVHAHVSEGTYEPEHNLRQHGMRTVTYYDHLGVSGPDLLASQCVQLDEAEIALMGERDIRMAHMPLSNCEVGGGIAPVPELLAQDVTVGLGSDGYIDDYFEIMRGAFLIHKATHLDPQVMPAQTVWRLATEGGAQALGLDRVGRIEPGWQADFQLIDAAVPTPLTAENLYDQLLLYRNASNVLATWVAGRLRYQDGKLVDADFQALRAHAAEAAGRLWAAA